MPTVNVSGIQVSFPYEPYECQVTYMEKVVEGLKKYQNAILESPTGTGKTLCLLCSSLAWLENKKAQIGNLALKNSLSIEDGGNSGSSNGRDGDQSGGYSNNKGRNGGGNTWGSGACIDEDVWLGYNHKTASQKGGKSFKEQMLKKLNEAAGHWGGETNFPKILYASRTHSQLNQAIQELKKTAYKYMKVSIVGSRDQLCIHPVVSKEKNSINKVYMCKNKVKNRSCHYYNNVEAYKSHAQNEVMDIEDLLACGKKNNVCPYYLAREMKDDADVVFTPYNYILDPKSRKAQGLDLSGNILIFDEAHNLGGICEESHSFELSNLDIATALSDLQSIITQVSEHQDSDKPFSDVNDSWVEDTFSHSGNNKQDFTLDDALRLKKILLELEEKLDAMPLSSEQVQAQSGSVMLQIFRDLGIDDHSKSSVQDAIDKMALSLNATSNAFSSKGLGLSKISDVLEIMFGDQGRRDMCHVASDFKVHIRAVEQKKNSDDFTAPSASKISRVLSYWCFNPGYTMTDLQRKGARMLILTSGTLSPINSFVSEFAVNFPIRLENPHVIDSKQVLIACLENGPDNVALNSSYKNRSNKEYLTSLGNTLVNFTRIVPRGFLVFFPSYGIMQQSIDFWHISGIYHRIEAKKQIFVEPKSKIELLEEMTNFYTRVNNPDYDGAVFMAVCRGKVSEGLDFADNNGRAVVITGLPFPPMFDAKVKLKMDFLTQKKTKGGMGGQEWYELQASRAVNQAIGRVIRHRNDFGAILLCDNRFSRSTHHLPRWLRSEVKKFNKFGALQRELMLFFKPHHHNVKELLYKTTEPKTSAAPHSTITHIPPNPHKRLRLEPSSAISDHSANQADLLSVYGDCGEPIEKCLKDDQGNKLFNALESMQKNFEKNPVKSSQNTSKQNIFKKTSKEPLKKLLIEGSTYNTNTFIDRLKDNMTLQDYDAFKRVLNVYKTEHNLAPLIHFLQDNISAPQYRFIAIGMSQLVRSVDREEFHNSFHITQADFRQACDVIDQDAKEQSIWDVNTQEIKVGNMRIKDFLVTNTITASATTTTNTNTLNNNNNNNNINNKNNNKNNNNTNNNNNNNSINSNNDNNNNNNNKDNNNNNNNNKTISTSKHYFSSKKSKVKVNNPSIRMFFSKESTVIGSVPPRVNNNNHNNNNNNKNHKDNNKNSKNINNKTDNKGNYENTNNNNFNNKNINNINVNNIDKKDNNSNNENITNVNNNKNDNDKTNNNNNKCTHTRMHPLMGRCKGCGEERCNICWQDISKNGKYCPKCGTRVKKSNIIYH